MAVGSSGIGRAPVVVHISRHVLRCCYGAVADAFVASCMDRIVAYHGHLRTVVLLFGT